MTLSADSQDKPQTEAQECGWTFPVGSGLTMPQMRTLGMCISEPRSPQETDHPFAEPGIFVIHPHDQSLIIDISNAPFARPALPGLLKRLQFVISENTPIHSCA